MSWLWWGMLLAFGLVWFAVIGLWLLAVRRDPGDVSDAQAQRLQNRWIIGGGLVLPGVSIAVLLAFGIPVGHGMLPLSADEDVLRIEVTGYQWYWQVEYPDAGVSLEDELHIPAGEPVHIHLRSNDVIRSFWVPRLAGKLDAIPGHENVLKLQADQAGVYRGLCAEFCGLLHADMGFTVEAHEREDFEQWLSDAARDD
ncbi:cytochrome c oxidase subunit II [Methylonatrum kenyense]|uniref:cytochrome c oxidase subunit II n=1 Tax=Methylonatrum kenyense TaxID=455253 RepID=UPI0020BE10EE|nr:cytochrome c oxidase subunit II [Methylonatrum kenyense]